MKAKTTCNVCGKAFLNVNLHKTKAHDIPEDQKLVFHIRCDGTYMGEPVYNVYLQRGGILLKRWAKEANDAGCYGDSDGNLLYLYAWKPSEVEYSYGKQRVSHYGLHLIVDENTGVIKKADVRYCKANTHRETDSYGWDAVPKTHYKVQKASY